MQLEAYNGPKARVAVSQFTDRTAKGAGYGGYHWYNPQIGNGMADMLSDALLQSNRFIVLERQALGAVLQEQDLAASGRVSRETGASIGQIEGAELLIKGAVTEFEPGAAGAGGGAGLGSFGWGGAVVGGVLGGLRQSHVAIVLQVVDARTSRILFSTTIEGRANDFNLGGFLAGFGRSFGAGAGLGVWQKTPVEKAIRIAIAQAVQELSLKTPQTYFHHGAVTPLKAPVSSQSLIPPSAPPASTLEASRKPVEPSPAKAAGLELPSTVSVRVSVANLRDAAGTHGKVIATLREGRKLSVHAEDKGWYLVQTEDGKEGWISKSLTTQ
jgi:curli biogenesis system outer membrane secretion channel CsgG